MQKAVSYLQKNTAGRDFAVGDIHGHTHLVRDGLKAINFNPEVDRLFGVGDLIDRGPDSLGALAMLSEPWFFSARGNHEQMLLDESPRSPVWRDNGGEWAQGLSQSELDTARGAALEMPLIYVVDALGPGRFHVLHGELFDSDLLTDGQIDQTPGYEILRYHKESIQWGRYVRFLRTQVGHRTIRQGLSPTYCGHSFTSEPAVPVESHFQIDTIRWCPTAGFLTFVEINTETGLPKWTTQIPYRES